MPSTRKHQFFPMPRRSAFTLIELLSAITIIAVLTTMVTFFTVSYVSYAQQNADKQTLTVLNDALTRYKCEGGNINALTAGAPIGHVIAAMQTAITWGGSGGYGHQVLQTGKTYPSSLIWSGGQGSNYVFYKYNSYDGYASGTVPKPAVEPYGDGIGYMANGGAVTYNHINLATSTGYWAWKSPTGVITGPLPAATANQTIPVGNSSVTFWSCANNSVTPSGNITSFACMYSSLTSIDVSGLTALTYLSVYYNSLTSLVVGNPLLTSLDCRVNNSLTSIDISKATGLTSLLCTGVAVTSIDVSHNTALQSCSVQGNFSTIDLSHNPALTSFSCTWNTTALTSLDVTYNPALTTLNCWGNHLTSLDVSHNPLLTTLGCYYNNLGPIYLGGNTPTSFSYTPQQNGYTPSLQ